MEASESPFCSTRSPVDGNWICRQPVRPPAELVWKSPVDGPLGYSFICDGDRCYGAAGADAGAVCLSLADGSTVWHSKGPKHNGCPRQTLVGRYIYMYIGTQMLGGCFVDAENGRQRPELPWADALPLDSTSCLLMERGPRRDGHARNCIYDYSRMEVVRLLPWRSTGFTLRCSETDVVTQPMYEPVKQFRPLARIDIETGVARWEYQASCNPAALHGDCLVVWPARLDSPTVPVVLNVDTGRPLWSLPARTPLVRALGSLAMSREADLLIHVVGDVMRPHEIVAHSLATGDVRWRHPLASADSPTRVLAISLVMTGNLLWHTDTDGKKGRLVVREAATGKELWSTNVPGKPVIDAVSRNRILVRSGKTLYCYQSETPGGEA